MVNIVILWVGCIFVKTFYEDIVTSVQYGVAKAATHKLIDSVLRVVGSCAKDQGYVFLVNCLYVCLSASNMNLNLA